MIFRMVSIYRKAKRGATDPTGFVGEEIMDAYVGAAIIPGIILGIVLVILGILGYSHLVASPSLAAKIIFWIFFFCGLVYTSIALLLGKLISNLVEQGKKIVKDNVHLSIEK